MKRKNVKRLAKQIGRHLAKHLDGIDFNLTLTKQAGEYEGNWVTERGPKLSAQSGLYGVAPKPFAQEVVEAAREHWSREAAREHESREATREQEQAEIRKAEKEHEEQAKQAQLDFWSSPDRERVVELNSKASVILEKWSDGNACAVLRGPIVEQVAGLSDPPTQAFKRFLEIGGPPILYREEDGLTLRIPLCPGQAGIGPFVEVLNPNLPDEETHGCGRYVVRGNMLEIDMSGHENKISEAKEFVYRGLRKHNAPSEWRPTQRDEKMCVEIGDTGGGIFFDLAQTIAEEVEKVLKAAD